MQVISQYFTDAINSKSTEWMLRIDVKKRLYNKREKPSDPYVVAPVLFTLDDDDIEEGTLKITRSAVKNNQFALLGAGSSRLDLALTPLGYLKMQGRNPDGSSMDRASRLCKTTFLDVWMWIKTADPNQGKIVDGKLDFRLNFDGTENTSGRIHCGGFYINDIESKGWSASIIAYDSFISFDRDLRSTEKKLLRAGASTAQELFEAFCWRCSKGIYDTILDPNIVWGNLPNPGKTWGCDNDSMFKQYREAAMRLGELHGSICVIDRENHLCLRRFNNGDADIEFTPEDIFDSDMAGTSYVLTQLETQVAGFDHTTTDTSHPDDDDKYVTIQSNENVYIRNKEGFYTPATTDMTQECKDIIDAMFLPNADLELFAGRITVPFRPDLDLCDKVSATIYSDFGDDITEVEYPSILVCSIVETYRSNSQIECYGYSGDVDIYSQTSDFKEDTGGGGGGAVASVVSFTGDGNKPIGANQVNLFRFKYVRVPAGLQVAGWFTATVTCEGTAEIEFWVEWDNIVYPQRFRYHLPSGRQTCSFSIALNAHQLEAQFPVTVYAKKYGTGTVELKDKEYQLILNANGAQSADPIWTGFYEAMEMLPNFSFDDFLDTEVYEHSNSINVQIPSPT